MSRRRVAVLDVDGTLIDSNDAHTRAWVEAGRALGRTVDYDEVRRRIGMGGDKVMPQVAGIEEDSPEGERFAELRGEIFRERYLPHLHPFPQARALLERMKSEGWTLVVASSASEDDLSPLLEQAGIRDLIEEKTSSDDAERSKPDPDIVQAALDSADAAPGDAVMLGDTPYDVEAAGRAGVRIVALRCGGWDDEGLRGAAAVYDDAADLLAHFDTSPFGGG